MKKLIIILINLFLLFSIYSEKFGYKFQLYDPNNKKSQLEKNKYSVIAGHEGKNLEGITWKR